jgi:hypothetical protein
MNEDFWWNWWVNLAVAVGTLGAVFAALFGDWFRSRFTFLQPRLLLRLTNTRGSPSVISLTSPDGSSRREDARFYHLSVVNERRWRTATQVQVHLMRIEEPNAEGADVVVWDGDVPMTWQHQQIYPSARDIGPTAETDLCSVVKDKWVQLHVLVGAFSLERWLVRRGRFTMTLTLQARAAEIDSSQIRVKITWDGMWEPGEVEMEKHLVIRQV